MSETKNVIIQQNNGTDYNILYPDSNSWKKDQVAILETFQKYGLDTNAVPKDLFDYLIGQIKAEYGKTYWWNRWKYTYTIDMTATDITGNTDISGSYTGTLYVAQFDSVQVIRDGTYIGNLKQVLTLKKYDELPYGYYYSNVYISKATAQSSKPICYANWDSSKGEYYTYISTFSEGRYMGISTACVLANVTKKTDESKVSSINPNAYSETQLPDSERYFYGLAEVIDSPVFGQVQRSFYTGTGTYGRDNPNTITFTGKPQLIFIQLGNYNSQFLNPAGAWAMSGNDKQDLSVTWGDNQVSWYSSDGAAMQGNEENYTYDFIVIQTI